MKKRPLLIDNIPAECPRNLVLYRLGYRRNNTEMTHEQERAVHAVIDEAITFCHPRGIWTSIAIQTRTEETLLLETGHTITSRDVVKMMQGCTHVVLGGTTCGRTIVDTVAAMTQTGRTADAVIFDQVGGQLADAALGWLFRYIKTIIRRNGTTLTARRFSPGYGDLHLSHQKILFELTEMHKLGVSISENYLMQPEKSVLALAGLGPISSVVNETGYEEHE
ncbi:MAG: hypothetical protein EOL87_05060 [Spartobacteria bacterium]|nr:hypothetical protein [Spartobacteria bacterium]